jgi:two-component system invasion response regulator UvrY
VGEAQSGETAVAFCRQHHPDVILMDMNMPGIGGLEATRKILRIRPDVRIIVLTIHSENPFPTKVMQAGAAGYLTKGAAPDEMIHAIRLVHSGQRYISPEIAQQMALSQFASADENPFKSLSERELQIMMMITKGQKVTDISEQPPKKIGMLFLTVEAVEGIPQVPVACSQYLYHGKLSVNSG